MKTIYHILCVALLVAMMLAQPMAEDVRIHQLRDGSGLVEICYRAINHTDSTISTNVLVTELGVFDEYLPVLTLRDTLSGYDHPNFGWRVSASDTGNIHCILWDMTTDLGDVENCGFRGNVAVFDSVLSAYSINDSFPANDSARATEKAFGLAYKRGELWLLFHEEVTDQCWIRPYSLPELEPGDSTFIGTVAVGPSDMAFAGDRLFWTEDTRVILKEFDWDLGDSRAVRSDWWDLPGTSVHLAGAAFDGEYLWVCFSEGTFVKMDTSTFSLVDTMFFPEFGVSTPATSADGLAWGLGILWCFSNDNVVYAIDTETKTIIHTIFTGEVVEMTGAEGAAWDGLNLWVVDYSRFHVYKLSLFDQITFYFSGRFCLDNQNPRLTWTFPDTLGVDTLIALMDTMLSWETIDSNITGSRTDLILWDDTVATLTDSTFSYNWTTIDWPGFYGRIVLSVTDYFGNNTSINSGRFYIEENIAPEFTLCGIDSVITSETEIEIPISFFDAEGDYITVSFAGPPDAVIEGDSLIRWLSPEIPDDTTIFSITICDFHLCDTCEFTLITAPNSTPYFLDCPDSIFVIQGNSFSESIHWYDEEGDSTVLGIGAPSWFRYSDSTMFGTPPDTGVYSITLGISDPWSHDSCNFNIYVVENLPPDFIFCPDDTLFTHGTGLSLILDYIISDPYSRIPAISVLGDIETHLISDSQLVLIPDEEGLFPITLTACVASLCDTCEFTVQVFAESILEQRQPRTKALKISPNPFNSTVSIDSDSKWNSMQILDLSGRQIFATGPANSLLWSPDNGLGTGVYLVVIRREKGEVETGKLYYVK